MRIDSMEASALAMQKSQDANTGKAGDTNSIGKPATSSFENLNYSQLSEYEKKELPISERVVIDAIEKANKAILGANTKFEFSIHEKTKEIMVKVVDAETHELIREIPPEKILDMVAKMWEMAGIIVDERR